jgi:hypothetical protein
VARSGTPASASAVEGVTLRRQLDPERIAGAHFARNQDDAHDSGLAEEVSLFVVVQDRHQTGPIVIQLVNGTG